MWSLHFSLINTFSFFIMEMGNVIMLTFFLTVQVADPCTLVSNSSLSHTSHLTLESHLTSLYLSSLNRTGGHLSPAQGAVADVVGLKKNTQWWALYPSDSVKVKLKWQVLRGLGLALGVKIKAHFWDCLCGSWRCNPGYCVTCSSPFLSSTILLSASRVTCIHHLYSAVPFCPDAPPPKDYLMSLLKSWVNSSLNWCQ